MDRQTTVEGIDGGLHPAVDRQWRVLVEGYILQWTDRRQWRALMEGYILQWTDDSGGFWWRATSCSGQTTVEGIDRGLHRAVDGQGLGAVHNRMRSEGRREPPGAGQHWTDNNARN